MYQITHRQQFSETTFLWDVLAPDVAKSARPGQFVMLRLYEGGERIPLTIADFDPQRGKVTIVIQAVGKTTLEMLRNYNVGDSFTDFVGPLGLESHTEKLEHVVLVGGGLGVAPIFPQLRAFKKAGCRTTAILGFRNKDLVFWEDKFKPYTDELIVCTDDGSYGRPGFVTAALADAVGGSKKPDLVIAIGPLPMMRACTEVTRPQNVRTVVSLNSIMVDGTGMCGSCRVTVDGQVQFACVDGPDFNAHGVDFGELIQRQARFKAQEKRSNEDFAHVCNLDQKLFKEEKRSYKKVKELAPHATPMRERNAEERSHNFLEVNLGYSIEDALKEAERCIQCKIPRCVAGCPVNVDIPNFIRHLLIRDFTGALDVINGSNPFPSICGRVCPQESQCESQCVLKKNIEPVAIGRLERFVGDYARPSEVRVPAHAGSLGRVAIVGSGPAGLACAADLAKAGAEVTIYEALHISGGVLQYGIPSFRLPRNIIEREINSVRKLGVKIETNKVVGKTFGVHQLMKEMEYDAVFIGTGAGYPSFLGIPGEHGAQVLSANEFLTRVNLMGGDRFPYEDTPVGMGKRVVVLGAGNTAMDCLRVARRLGAEEVHCVYRRTESEAPARIEELRHAKEEGIHFNWLLAPTEIKLDEQGCVQALVCQKMELGEPDASGRRKPVPVKDAFITFDCDTVIYALGTRANPIIRQATPDLAMNKWGYIQADDKSQATNLPGVYAGGDIVTGGATVILAMGAGKRAAKSMVDYLNNKKAGVTTGADQAVQLAEHGRSCPKCHRPIEGPVEPGETEESYICCADSLLKWHCTQCSKVYEGFAFPYGLCAMCGGKLAIDHQPELASQESRSAIRHAMEIELGGLAFYSQGAAAATDPALRALFGRLAEMEKEHAATLSRRYHIEVPPLSGTGLSPSQIAVYAGVEHDAKDPAALLRLALVLERCAVVFFESHEKTYPEDSPHGRLYRELAAEEREHVAMIATELARFLEGKPGLM
ncbi:NADPH-dependent glutamate synthase [Bdellovibrionota bacterium FG-1]